MAFLLAIKKSQFNSPTHTHHWIITSGMARISVKINIFFEEVKAKGVRRSHAANPTKTNLFVKMSLEIEQLGDVQ